MTDNNNLQLHTTSDGSFTIWNDQLKQTYHSRHGALQESRHVFINAGFHEILRQYQADPLKKLQIFEMGFGTGLNAWLTASLAIEKKVKIDYEAIETIPLGETIWQQLNYPTIANSSRDLFNELHKVEWNQKTSINNYFTLKKITGQLQQHRFDKHFDLIYYDAFSPESQPELWTIEIFLSLFEAMNTNGILTTYSSKGSVRRNMQAAGFFVEKLQGPPGKREMLRAIKK